MSFGARPTKPGTLHPAGRPNRNLVGRCLLALIAACLLAVPPRSAGATETGSAVILLYHHVADDTPASTSVSPALFAAHLDYLQTHDYQVLPLSQIMAALRSGDPLPARSVAITFDDAYRSVYTTAAPQLQRRGWSFAVFTSTDYLDLGFGSYMTWDQLRALELGGAEIGNHSRRHQHLVHRRLDEAEAAWHARVSEDIHWAQQRLATELRKPLPAFAYPYGEYDRATAHLVNGLGLTGFGQQSGPVDHTSNPGALPRFPMAGNFASLDNLAEKLQTRVLHVNVQSSEGPVLRPGAPAPILRLQLNPREAGPDTLRCYVTGQPPALLRWLDSAPGMVEVRARQPLAIGRSKYTCTAPVAGAPGSYYWYSHLWMMPPQPGAWYDG